MSIFSYQCLENKLGEESMLLHILKSLRPKQWTKNFLLFAALIFTDNWRSEEKLILTCFAYVVFCFISGGIYLLNDVLDAQRDRLHPVKRKRPVASGVLPKTYAVAAGLGFILTGLLGSFRLNYPFFLTVAFLYFLLQLAYSLALKNVVILDALMISAGFVLRAVAGAVAISVKISPWILVCTGLLALFLALGKRRHELILLRDQVSNHRLSLQDYSIPLLDQMLSVVASSTVVAYSLYTFTSETAQKTHYLMLTIPFVFYGIFRYFYLIHKQNMGGEPEDIFLQDKPLLINILLWVATCSFILYAKK